MLKISTLLLIVFISGCAAPKLYQWGGYEKNLYDSYKDPNQFEAMRIELESVIASNSSSGQKIPPGMYAELGTLYLQKGDSNKAIEFYKKERDIWPESKGLMTALIQNLERRPSSQKEVAK